MRYVSKPQEVEAVQWNGARDADDDGGLDAFFGSAFREHIRFGWPLTNSCEIMTGKNGAQGWVPVPVGHWIVKGGDPQHFWPCDPDTFADRYEPVEPVHIYERVIELHERADGSFLVFGQVDADEGAKWVADYLTECLGADGWSDLVVHDVIDWRGRWVEVEFDDERFEFDDDGDPWTYVMTDYEIVTPKREGADRG